MAGLIKRIATVSAILTQGTGRYKDGVEIINEYPCKVFPTENFTQIFANSNPIQSDTAFLVPSMLIKPRLPATLIINTQKYNIAQISEYRNLKGKLEGYRFVVAKG